MHNSNASLEKRNINKVKVIYENQFFLNLLIL